jgi:elongation factor 1-beta
MGEIVAVYKVMPENPDTDHDAILEELETLTLDGVTIETTETEPVAFGLEALMVTISMPDSEEISADEMEQSFAKVDGVESVSVDDVGRV